MLLMERLQIGNARAKHIKCKPRPGPDLFGIATLLGKDQLSSEFSVQGEVQFLDVAAQLRSLFDAGQNLETAHDRFFVQITIRSIKREVRRSAAHGRRPKMIFKGSGQLLRSGADNIFETVVPKTE